jgi:hypothetical protein
MKIHFLCALFPLLQGAAFQAFKADIAAHGQRDPIWTYRGKIIDGRNRYRACRELGIKPRFRAWDGNGSLAAFVISLNLHRRHLTSSQRAALAVELLPLLEEEARDRQRRHGGTAPGRRAVTLAEIFPGVNGYGEARAHAARLLGTNPRHVSDAKRVRDLDPELFDRVKAGDVRVHRARREAEGRSYRRELADTVTAVPEEIRAGDFREVLADLPAGSVNLMFADPP